MINKNNNFIYYYYCLRLHDGSIFFVFGFFFFVMLCDDHGANENWVVEKQNINIFSIRSGRLVGFFFCLRVNDEFPI